MSATVAANLRQIVMGALRVAELSREIRRSVAVGDGPAAARDAAALATVSARIQYAESAIRQEVSTRQCCRCANCDGLLTDATANCALCGAETEVVL